MNSISRCYESNVVESGLLCFGIGEMIMSNTNSVKKCLNFDSVGFYGLYTQKINRINRIKKITVKTMGLESVN